MNQFGLASTGAPQHGQAAIKIIADINAQDWDGKTALIYAARGNQNPEVIATLLKADANHKAQTMK
jgi:ankyrin repeat protein